MRMRYVTLAVMLVGLGVAPAMANGINNAIPVPDGGMTILLLCGALVGLETLRQKFRV